MLAVSRVEASWYAAVVGKVSSSVLGSNRATGCASSFILFPFLSCKSCKEEVMKSWEAPCF